MAKRLDDKVVAAARARASEEHRCLECGERVVLRSQRAQRCEELRGLGLGLGAEQGDLDRRERPSAQLLRERAGTT